MGCTSKKNESLCLEKRRTYILVPLKIINATWKNLFTAFYFITKIVVIDECQIQDKRPSQQVLLLGNHAPLLLLTGIEKHKMLLSTSL